MADTTIIYDFGANVGDNLGYYLDKADLVVAVEANPALCRTIEDRFATEIAAGRLVVENVVVVADRGPPTTPFFIHRRNHVLSQLPRPAADRAGQFREVVLPSRHVVDVVAQHGPAHYIKIDVEHSDAAILRALLINGIMPDYISAESHDIAVFCLLVAMGGYDAFKLVDGPSVHNVFAEHVVSTPQGPTVRRFPRHSAGPFGNDLPGPWLDKTALFHVLSRAGLGWKDIHASRIDAPVAPLRDHSAAAPPPKKTRDPTTAPGNRSGCLQGELLVVADPLLFMTSAGQPIVSRALDRSALTRTPETFRQEAAAARDLPVTVHDEPAIILSCKGDRAFYHFLYDALGKLAVAELHGITPAHHAIYLDVALPWQIDALQSLGVTPQPLVGQVLHRFRRGVIPTYPCASARPTKESVGFLRRRFRRPETDHLPGRKLFVSRQSGINGRLLENEAEIYERSFRQHGYELVDPGTLPFGEQCLLFSQATHLAGPHGAAFSLLCLGRLPLSVIELHSPHYHAACFRRAATVLGGHYAAFNARNWLFQPSEWRTNFTLDAPTVATWLASLPPGRL